MHLALVRALPPGKSGIPYQTVYLQFIYSKRLQILFWYCRKNKIVKCPLKFQYSSRNDVQEDDTDHWGTVANKWESSHQWRNILGFIKCGCLTDIWLHWVRLLLPNLFMWWGFLVKIIGKDSSYQLLIQTYFLTDVY